MIDVTRGGWGVHWKTPSVAGSFHERALLEGGQRVAEALAVDAQLGSEGGSGQRVCCFCFVYCWPDLGDPTCLVE